VPSGAKLVTARVGFSGGTTPSDVVGVVQTTLDGQSHGEVTFGQDLALSLDVSDTTRVTLVFRVANDELPQSNIVTFVVLHLQYER